MAKRPASRSQSQSPAAIAGKQAISIPRAPLRNRFHAGLNDMNTAPRSNGIRRTMASFTFLTANFSTAPYTSGTCAVLPLDACFHHFPGRR
jgi:hypothetical protein